MHSLWQDFRYALRSLAKTPGFTLVALLTLALGIGANSAIFSVVNGVLLRRCPIADADRLVVVRETYGGGLTGSVSAPNFTDWRSRRTHSRAWRPHAAWPSPCSASASPRRSRRAMVSSDFFRTLGVTPVLGRGLLPGEDQGQGTVAVISEGLWRERFGADREILGRTVNLSGRPLHDRGRGAGLTRPIPAGHESGSRSASGSAERPTGAHMPTT